MLSNIVKIKGLGHRPAPYCLYEPILETLLLVDEAVFDRHVQTVLGMDRIRVVVEVGRTFEPLAADEHCELHLGKLTSEALLVAVHVRDHLVDDFFTVSVGRVLGEIFVDALDDSGHVFHGRSKLLATLDLVNNVSNLRFGREALEGGIDGRSHIEVAFLDGFLGRIVALGRDAERSKVVGLFRSVTFAERSRSFLGNEGLEVLQTELAVGEVQGELGHFGLLSTLDLLLVDHRKGRDIHHALGHSVVQFLLDSNDNAFMLLDGVKRGLGENQRKHRNVYDTILDDGVVTEDGRVDFGKAELVFRQFEFHFELRQEPSVLHQ